MKQTNPGVERAPSRRDTAQDVGAAIRDVQCRGYLVGRQVRIGTVLGTILGYNIARRGRFRGSAFPLVVHTPYGIAKCSTEEAELA